MAKAVSEKKYITFVKGLITEANALTFPENASLDEDNFDLHTNGSRSRRLGIDYEDGYALTATGLSATIIEGTKESFHKWDFPGGATTVSIGVVRVYNKLWFIDLLATTPSASLLNGGASITISGLANSEIETSTINGFFVIVSADLDWPIVLTYNKTSDSVSQESFPIQIRDMWGVEDNLEVNERPTSLSETHEYNLRNQGWSSQIDSVAVTYNTWANSTVYAVGDIVTYGGIYYVCITAHTSQSSGSIFYTYFANWAVTSITEPAPEISPNRAVKFLSGTWSFITEQVHSALAVLFTTKLLLTVYPSNTDIWTLGKIGSSTSTNFEKYDPTSLKRNSIDNTEAPKGSHILELYQRGYSRRILTGLTTLPLDVETGRLATVTTYAGRVCYSGIVSSTAGTDGKTPNLSGSVFFSQIVENKQSIGKCFQEADPTSSVISDIVDTDGGIIQFPEASRIIKLVTVKDSLLVFAENGIWEIYSDAGGFKATSYQTAKISTTGISNAKSIVVAGDTVVYWAKAGILAASPNQQTGRYQVTSLSLPTIQTFYTEEISDLAKKTARGFFDEKSNHVRWVYNDSVSYSESVNANHYNRILNLDLTLQAFYKYSIGSISGTSPAIVDFIEIPSHAVSSSNEDVYVGNDTVLVVADQVQVPISTSSTRNGKYSFLTFTGTSFTVSKYKDTTFVDWKTANSVGVDAPAYLITGYETFNEITRTKQVPYIWFYLNRTETGFASSGGGLVALNPSSCLVQAQWNWSNSDAQGKWGTQFQVYRYLKTYIPSGVGDTYDTGDSIIVTKNKFRGSGKALSLKINSEAGKDLQLLGWALIVTGDGTP